MWTRGSEGVVVNAALCMDGNVELALEFRVRGSFRISHFSFGSGSSRVIDCYCRKVGVALCLAGTTALGPPGGLM